MDDRNLRPLPRGWVWTTLEAIADIIQGQSPPSSTYNEERKGLPFYQGKLDFGKTYPSPTTWCNAPTKIAEKDDVLISVRAPVGPTNICLERSCIGRGLAAIRGADSIETFFILYLMRAFEQILSGQGTGTTFNAITGNHLRNLVFPLPPLPEQRRIVARIEDLFTNLDSGIEALNKVKTQLKRYRQSVLKAAFEGSLTAEWQETHKGELEPASALLEKIKAERAKSGKYKELPPLDTSGLPELPEGWVWAMVGDISEKIHYGHTASADSAPIGPKMIRITDIQNNSVNWDAVPYCKINPDDKPSYLLQEGDILFARTGATVGKSYLIKGAIPEAVFASYLIRVILPKHIIKGYVSNFFQSYSYWLQIRQGQIGIGQPNVNSQTLSKITLPLAPLNEQEKILEEIERHFSVADEIEKTIEQGLKQAERLRQSILKSAFEGKLVPQHPNDEPAEKLLERIKASRAGATNRPPARKPS